MESAELGSQRGNWGSKVAFIFAASGSAIGLGSIWRFPLYVGLNGGAFFVLFYIMAVFFIGFTVMLAELTIGRHAQKNPVGAFEYHQTQIPLETDRIHGCDNRSLHPFLLFCDRRLGCRLFLQNRGGRIPGRSHLGEFRGAFLQVCRQSRRSSRLPFPHHRLDQLCDIPRRKRGIERWSKILMPVLFVLIIVLAVRALMLPDAKNGFLFFFKPDFSEFNPKVLFYAVGQAFFSLSLGMGTMMTYGSYIPKKDNLVSSAGWVCFSTTLIAILAGIIIFPTLFSTLQLSPEQFKQEFEVSLGLMFQVFPIIISQMPGGYIFGILFFALLLIAALTSTISMLEVPTAYLVDERKWSRNKASIVICIMAFFMGIPSALSAGGSKFLTDLNVMVNLDLVFGNILLALGGLMICLFLAYVWKIRNALKEISHGNSRFWLKPIWVFNVSILAPIAVIILLIFIRTFTG